MGINKFIDSNDLKLSLDEIDNSLSTVNTKITELTNEVAAIKEQVDSIRNTTLEHSFPNGYALAKDSDFNWREDYPWYGAWDYVGADDKIVIPHTIYGKEVTSYRGMFFRASVSGVYCDNKNVTDMSYMFHQSKATNLDLTYLNTSSVTNMNSMFDASQATTLDLSNFNTSNVTNMDCMFYGSQATSLDLSNFDTSKVTNMNGMFYGSKVKTLDLFSFDMSKVTYIYRMFENSITTIGYTRTQEDVDKFNTSSHKPSTLTFMVNPQTN